MFSKPKERRTEPFVQLESSSFSSLIRSRNFIVLSKWKASNSLDETTSNPSAVIHLVWAQWCLLYLSIFPIPYFSRPPLFFIIVSPPTAIILHYLGGLDLLRFSGCCKLFYNGFFQSASPIWKELCKKRNLLRYSIVLKRIIIIIAIISHWFTLLFLYLFRVANSTVEKGISWKEIFIHHYRQLSYYEKVN